VWANLRGPRPDFARFFVPRLILSGREIEPTFVQNERTAAPLEGGRYLARCVYGFPAKELEPKSRVVLVVRDPDGRDVSRVTIDLAWRRCAPPRRATERARIRLGRARRHRCRRGAALRGRADGGALVHADRVDRLRPVRRRAQRASHRPVLSHHGPARRPPRGPGVRRVLVALRALQRAALLAWRRRRRRDLVALPRARAESVPSTGRLRLGFRDHLPGDLP